MKIGLCFKVALLAHFQRANILGILCGTYYQKKVFMKMHKGSLESLFQQTTLHNWFHWNQCQAIKKSSHKGYNMFQLQVAKEIWILSCIFSHFVHHFCVCYLTQVNSCVRSNHDEVIAGKGFQVKVNLLFHRFLLSVQPDTRIKAKMAITKCKTNC